MPFLQKYPFTIETCIFSKFYGWRLLVWFVGFVNVLTPCIINLVLPPFHSNPMGPSPSSAEKGARRAEALPEALILIKKMYWIKNFSSFMLVFYGISVFGDKFKVQPLLSKFLAASLPSPICNAMYNFPKFQSTLEKS